MGNWLYTADGMFSCSDPDLQEGTLTSIAAKRISQVSPTVHDRSLRRRVPQHSEALQRGELGTHSLEVGGSRCSGRRRSRCCAPNLPCEPSTSAVATLRQ
jgi:hypothetical protein